MPNEVTSRYANNHDQPDQVICKQCSHGKTERVVILRDEIGHHDRFRHGGVPPVHRGGNAMDGFSELESTLRGFWDQNGPRDVAGLLAVTEAAQNLLDQLIPFTPGGLDEMLGNMLVMRRMNDSDKAEKRASQGRYDEWAPDRDLLKCVDCSRETGTFLVLRSGTHLHDRDVHGTHGVVTAKGHTLGM